MKRKSKKDTRAVAIYTRVATEAQVSLEKQRDLVLDYYMELSKK